VAPGPYRHHRAAWRGGRYDWVITRSARVLADLGPEAAADRWGPGVVARLGMALARRQQYPAARAELERAVAALPGSAASADLGNGEQVSVQLLEVLAALGDLAPATVLATQLRQHGRHPATRGSAARTLARLHLAAGNTVTAHRWLDDAAGLAAVGGADLPLALVHADRAVVVASDNRPNEALTMIGEALDRLQSTSGPPARLATEQGAMTAAAVVLATINTSPGPGDELVTRSGELAARAAALAVVPDRPVTAALVDLAAIATGQVRDARGRTLAGTALEERVQTVVDTFAEAGTEPLRALAVRQQALVASSHGHRASAAALAAHAAWAFERLELPVEASRTRQLLESLQP
jgi:tetratricopeptide (TPR) repeat protein